MKRSIALLFVFFIAASLFAQTDGNSKPAEFVYVKVPHLSDNFSNTSLEFTAYYSNGQIQDISPYLNLPAKEKSLKEDSVIAQYEFKMLEYFYAKGYELISAIQQSPSVRRQFYFKHK